MHTQILPYQNNSAELFDHFAHLPQAVFLDSCLPQQDQGRYDIISAMPIKIISESEDVFVEIEKALRDLEILTPTFLSKNLLHKSSTLHFPASDTVAKCNAGAMKRPHFASLHLATVSEALKPISHEETTPSFTIGAIGYLSYDIGRELEMIPTIAADDITLPKACVGIYDWSIVVDHQTKKTTLHAIDSKKADQIIKLLNTKPNTFDPFSLTKPFQSNLSKMDYKKAFDEIKKNIVAGNCYQVNFAQRFSAQFTGSSWHAYKTLREKNPAPFSAFMNLCNGDHNTGLEQTSILRSSDGSPRASESVKPASILCCSPERLLKIENNTVETKPIKGTSKRFSDLKKDLASANALLNSEKDRAENIMIVDLLRNDLSKTCTDVTVQQLCALESFSNVHHLVSTITAKLSPNTTSIDVFKNCFPGGSITGAPKIAAMKIIESLEPHRRSVYCGSIFYADISGNFDSNIVIRTAICDDNKIHCYAGGGIVYDSDCEKEYIETLVKINKIIDILQS